MKSIPNSILNKQFQIALCLTLTICVMSRPWGDYLTKPSLSSHETRNFNDLVENPQRLKAILQQKIKVNPNDDYAKRLLTRYHHLIEDGQKHSRNQAGQR